jgi:hypothetical protein
MFCESNMADTVENSKLFLKNNQAIGVHPYKTPLFPDCPLIPGQFSQGI